MTDATSVGDHEISENLSGKHYLDVLKQFHERLQPRTYFEIGTATGTSLALAKCSAIAVDPRFVFDDMETIREIIDKPSVGLYQMGSDAFFARYSLSTLFGAPVDMAFLDGMHRCEYLLRDFINTERHCRRNSIIILHDCLPVEKAITSRSEAYNSSHPVRRHWWAGDVWRTALLLKRRRTDLEFTSLDAAPTGLVIVSNLNPDNAFFGDEYSSHVREMTSWDLDQVGVSKYFAEMNVEGTEALEFPEQTTARFWL